MTYDELWATTTADEEGTLPEDGEYVCKVLNAESKTSKDKTKEFFVVDLQVVEGQYKGMETQEFTMYWDPSKDDKGQRGIKKLMTHARKLGREKDSFHGVLDMLTWLEEVMPGKRVKIEQRDKKWRDIREFYLDTEPTFAAAAAGKSNIPF